LAINFNFLLSNRNYSKTTHIASIEVKFVLVGHKLVLIDFCSKFAQKRVWLNKIERQLSIKNGVL